MDKLEIIKDNIRPLAQECIRVGGLCHKCNATMECKEVNAQNTGYSMRGVYELLEHLERKI